jgi:hypothetical protein
MKHGLSISALNIERGANLFDVDRQMILLNRIRRKGNRQSPQFYPGYPSLSPMAGPAHWGFRVGTTLPVELALVP